MKNSKTNQEDIKEINNELKEDKIKIKFDNSKKPRLFSIKYLMEQGLLELEK